MIAIEHIYDAAFDRSRFPALLEALAQHMGAQSAFIAWSDADRAAGFQAQVGNDPKWLTAYVETYAPHDILRPILQALPEGQSAAIASELVRPIIRESIFYREYLAPQGIVDNLAVNLIKRPGIMAHLAFIRCAPAEPFTPDDCSILNGLVPHLRRAIFIQSHLVRAADHFDARTQPVGGRAALLLDADLRILAIDPTLSVILPLREGDTIGEGVVGGAIRSVMASGEPMAIELPDRGISIMIETRQLDPDRFGDLAGETGASHGVYIARLDQAAPIAFDALARLYRLTPTELRVLRDSLEHGDLAGIGDRLGMARATARTHLHRIYDKTGTGSFAGLASLAHRFGQMFPPVTKVEGVVPSCK